MKIEFEISGKIEHKNLARIIGRGMAVIVRWFIAFCLGGLSF